MVFKFSPGDKAALNKDKPGYSLSLGDVVTILDTYVVTIGGIQDIFCDVKASDGDEYTMSEDDLTDIQLTLPVGNQEVLTKHCDCGGYLVYGSKEPMMHSRWCKFLEEK